jgi:hypothetical protein
MAERQAFSLFVAYASAYDEEDPNGGFVDVGKDSRGARK